MFALNLNEDNRVLSVTYPQYAPENAPQVETLPKGDLYDYLYVNGEFVYDPLPVEPQPEPVDEMAQMKEQIQSLTESNQMLTDCILEMSELLYQ